MPKIKSITIEKNEDVYDISVPETVNFFANDILVHNCVEIGMYPVYVDEDNVQHSGWQGCNLTEINGGRCVTENEFYKACRAGAILGTLQAGYTDFKYLGEHTKKIFEQEALLGVSITGWMNNPDVLLSDKTQKHGAEIVKKINAQVANLIGINQAARTTCVKPSGNASVLLQTASGIHAEHSPKYIRHIQMNKESEVAQLIAETNPYMIEESVNSANGTDYVIAFPIVSPEGSLYKDELLGKNLLEKVKQVQQNWVEYGTNEDLCTHPKLRHNVSNTITVLPHQWSEIEDYVYENRHSFAGISFLSNTGDMDYAQAPFTKVLDEEEIIAEYGAAALFASGLIVDTLSAGFRDLWEATAIAKTGQELHGELSDLRKDWLRRFEKFAITHFDGDTTKAEYCLKSVAILYKWTKIQKNMVDIDFVAQLQSKRFTEIDTMGAVACQGGQCEISF